MLSPNLTLKKAQRQNETDQWTRLFIILIFLLMSIGCIFCSSQSALWFIDRSHIKISPLTSKYADYSLGPLIPVSHVDATRIALERLQDDRILKNLSEPVRAAGILVNIPQQEPTPTFLPPVTPTPTITPTSRPETTATPVSPTPTPPPSPTPASPTAIATLPPLSTATPAATLPPPSTATPEPTLPPPSTATPEPTLPLPPDDDDDDDEDEPPPPPDTATPTPTPIPPVVQFSALTYRVTESAGQAVLTVTLDKPSAQTVSINYATTDSGPATAGQDYERVNNTLTFAPGQTQKTFSVPILDDNLYELPEDVALFLSNPTNATLGSVNPVTLEISDDDPRPALSFEESNYTTPEKDGPAVITATLDNPSSLAVTTVYTVSDGGAMAGADYLTQTERTLTFGPGQTVATFTVTIIGDTLTELDEKIFLALGEPANASLGSSKANLTILDDDTSLVQFKSALYSTLESASQATITATLSLPSAIPLTVDYTTSDLTALAGQDYVAADNTLTFNPGQTSASFAVTITDDDLREPAETVFLSLSNPAPAGLITLDSLITATLTITDGSDTNGCNDPLSPIPPGEPDIGPADGDFMEVYCNSAFIVELGSDVIDTTSSDMSYDFAYYEEARPTPPTSITHIRLDRVIIEVAPAINGPWYQVFYWGDTITDTNTNIGQAGYGPATSAPSTIETDNEFVGIADLHASPASLPYQTGIAIDVDAKAPPDVYRYLRFSVPNGGNNDVMEIDAIEILP